MTYLPGNFPLDLRSILDPTGFGLVNQQPTVGSNSFLFNDPTIAGLFGLPTDTLGLQNPLGWLSPQANTTVGPDPLLGFGQRIQQEDSQSAMLKQIVMFMIMAQNMGIGDSPLSDRLREDDVDPPPPPPPAKPVYDAERLGPKDPSVKDGALTPSGQTLADIYNDPTKAKEAIRKDLEKALGTKEPSKILKAITGIDITTAQNHIVKQMDAFALYDQVLNQLTQGTLKSMNLETTLSGAEKGSVMLGGVVLSAAAVEKCRKEPDKMAQFIREDIENTTGSKDPKTIMNKIFNDNRTFTADRYETYLKTVIDLQVKNTKKMLNLAP
jgi:hypothetical protein